MIRTGARALLRSATLGLALVAAAAASDAAAAQAWEDYDFRTLEFRGIGVEGGSVWPARAVATTGFALRLDLGFVGSGTRIAPTARFWSSSLAANEVERLAQQIVLVCERQVDVSCPAELNLGEVRLSDLELGVDAQHHFFASRRITPFVGASLGLHLLNARGDFIDGTFVEDLLDTVAPGIGPTLGINVRLGSSIQLMTEMRLMLASEVRYASFSGGGVWRLPTPAGE